MIAVNAQTGSLGSTDPRSMGMGKTYTSTALGVNAIGINPANLLEDGNYNFNISTVLPLPRVSIF